MTERQGTKRQRVEEEEDQQVPVVEDKSLRLREDFRAIMGGRKYCQESELTRPMLLNFLRASGVILEVELFKVMF